MRVTLVIVFLFLLTAFLIGTMNPDVDVEVMDRSLNNASQTLENINFTNIESDSGIPNMNGVMLILEKYVQFVGVFGIEVTRAAIYFGRDNPDYFKPDFILKIVWWILIFMLLTALIKPAMYLVAFVIIGTSALIDKLKSRRAKRKEKWERER